MFDLEVMALLPNTVVRGGWDAEEPRNIWAKPRVDHPVGHVLITNSGSAPCDTRDDCAHAVRQLQACHMRQDMLPDIKQK